VFLIYVLLQRKKERKKEREEKTKRLPTHALGEQETRPMAW